ncbi:hypothetical protein GQ55_5G394500 [Panicum hallii var. hallii]|uniref:Retrotransposon protein, putative, Ty1-copia subclass n=1 Tax=Panicum hallii var. hallii TaxID=1504633 RepID=A0A2T7DN87_9POAL|nr:hypothetical protein GQ55_5G394500 [Panicum hallii var. hallii]
MPFTAEKTTAFPGESDTALGCILSLLSDQIYDVYMDYTNPTELWDALERKFAVKGGHLLYTYKQFYDFNIDTAKSIVAQAHEKQLLVGGDCKFGLSFAGQVCGSGHYC